MPKAILTLDTGSDLCFFWLTADGYELTASLTFCPYSKATWGNIEVVLKAKGKVVNK